MKNVSSFFVFLLIGVFFFGAADVSAQQKKMKKKTTAWAAEDLKWVPMGAAPDVMSATLWGDMNKGAYGALIKFPPGFKAPLHTHTQEGRGLVLSGTVITGAEGAEKRLGPGSYFFSPSGFKHTTAGGEDSPTVFLWTQPGKFDINWIAMPAAWDAGDIKWEPMQGAPEGVMSSTLWGDPTKGSYGGLTKFEPGFSTPLHYHTNDMKLLVVKGAYIHNGKRYDAGSYLFIPGGDKHTSDFDTASVLFIEQPGKFDVNMIEEKMEKKEMMKK